MCLHMLVNTLPMCVVLGVLYRNVAASWFADFDIDNVDVRSYEHQVQ